MTASSQLRVLTIHEEENREAGLFRLEKGWTLHFVLGPSLAGKHVRIFVNHPTKAKSGPNRQKYRELTWENLSNCKADVYDNFAEVHMVLAGSFNYFFTINGSDKEENANGHGYFLVDPVLRCGQFYEKIPLDGICCQTVLAKSLGPFSEWEARLRAAKEVGYNMVHMTPIQELGKSNSSYCIKDQLKLNSVFSEPGSTHSLNDVKGLVDKMCKEWEVLSLTDLVFNHTANESAWLEDHPECAYNMINSPHLKPAYLLDTIIWNFSEEIANGVWTSRGIPPEINSEEHLKIMREILANEVISKHKIHEYYLIHVDDTLNMFKDAIKSMLDVDLKIVIYCTDNGAFGRDLHDRGSQEVSSLELITDPQFRRLKASVDMKKALHLFDVNHGQISNEAERVTRCCSALKGALEELNHRKYQEVQSHLEAAIGNILANTRYRFVDPHGPRIPRVLAEDEPIMWNYFTLPRKPVSVEETERQMHTDWGAHCMAHNGWVMGDDPLRDFAAPGSNVYLRRELIPWGDNVKLRYGSGREDCPYLWDHMANYVRETATIFHGVRLDNCHSTPIHVAEYMLDEGRKVRPDLYVIAELFTSSEHLDNVFINRLGLNSLIREGLNASDAHDLGRLVHRYGGGSPVGAFFQPPARPLTHAMAHAMLLDQTHDNPSPIEKRSAFDLFPSSALIAMACCASGSNRGYDELVPHHINVVTEKRLYMKWNDLNKAKVGYTSASCGINAAKKVLNKLHQDLAAKGFSQVYVDKIKGDVVAVTRHNPISHQSVILAARTAFTHPDNSHTEPFILTAPGIIEEILFEGKLLHKDSLPQFQKSSEYINGLQNYVLSLRENIKVKQSEMVEPCPQSSSQFAQEVEFVSFPPGSVIAFKVVLHHSVKQDVLAIRRTLSQFGYRMRTLSARNVSELSNTELENLLIKLSHNDLNRLLYRCDAEERGDGKGIGTYNIPGHGDLPYCGLHGVMSVLRNIRAGNELGHPLCNNIRSGDWLCEYITNRLKAFPTTEGLGVWFEKVFSHLIKIPRYLIPCYFDAIVTGVYLLAEEVAWAKMSKFVSTGSTLVRTLAIGSLQLCSFVPTARLPTLSPNLALPLPPQAINQNTAPSQQACLSLAAGLPHFASGIWRSWGRDTFISLRGLLLLTGRFDEARFTILAYAGCLRHGLIPNLLAEGVHARYNCRDAVWWWLYCVQQYCSLVPNGTDILRDKVSRLYPTDSPTPQPPGACDMALQDVMQEALQKHASGISYREHNAGRGLDSDMDDQGFNITCGVDWSTGFVYGGNPHNCGTWMDKMGSSEKAGNKGQPATPRDGSAIELVGLCKATVRWLADLYRQGLYPHEGVTVSENGQTKLTTFQDWNQMILTNFERHFWISSKPDKDNESRPDLINKRGVYKDSVGASAPWTDFQLRPNVPVAMVVAPEMFTPSYAWLALENTEKHLLGPLGMKTLDPGDWAYHGDYDNSNDSDDKKLAKGWNYHQGPEWVWLTGFFLRARLYFGSVLESSQPGTVQDTMDFVRNTLSRHNVHINKSSWQSLPELTNSNGQFCRDSCEAQAWSVACILEVLYDLENISNKL